MDNLTKKERDKMGYWEYLAYLTRKANFAIESRDDYNKRFDFAKNYGLKIEADVENLLKQESLSIELIADAFKMPIDTVLRIKKDMDKPKKESSFLDEPKTKAKKGKMDVLDYLAKIKRSNDRMDYELALEYAREQGFEKGRKLAMEERRQKEIL